MQPAVLVKFGEREVTVRELTVSKVIYLLKASDERDPVNLDLLLDLPGATDVILGATGLSLEGLEEALPSQVAGLLEEVKKVNPHYAGAAQKLKEEMERIRDLLPASLSGLPAGSSSSATPASGSTDSPGS